MPPEAVKVLADAVHKALERPECGRASSGTDIYWSGPKEFDAFVKSELVSWTAMIKEAGIQPE
jgi:tripartite-type tricarboxylate transporter receptor subunit TctC